MNHATALPVSLRDESIQSEINELHRSIRLMTDALVREATDGQKSVSRHRGDSSPPMGWVADVQNTVAILADLRGAIASLEDELATAESELN